MRIPSGVVAFIVTLATLTAWAYLEDAIKHCEVCRVGAFGW